MSTSTTTPFSISPATPLDKPTLTSLVAASKLQLSINHFLFTDWPNPSAQLPVYTRAVETSFKDPQVTFLKVVDNTSGDVVGHVVLTRRSGDSQMPAGDADGKQQQDLSDGFNPEVFSTVARMTASIDAEMAGIDHIQITHIFVAPSHRNQGIGSSLVRLAADKAKATGLPLFVSSEPGASSFFLKHCFTETKHVDVDLSQWAPPNSGWGVFRLSGMRKDV